MRGTLHRSDMLVVISSHTVYVCVCVHAVFWSTLPFLHIKFSKRTDVRQTGYAEVLEENTEDFTARYAAELKLHSCNTAYIKNMEFFYIQHIKMQNI